jgi:biotin transporter BioY
MKRKNLIVSLTLSALFCTLICVGSFIRIPMPNMMPVTLQTFFVLLTALVLPMKATILAIITYIGIFMVAKGNKKLTELNKTEGKK